MPWTVTDGPKYVKLTRKLAEEVATMERCPDDRELSESRLSYLRKEIAEERFRSPDWAFACCTETKKKYRVNGKHTSNLLASMEKLPDIKVSITEYTCPTLQDVAALYSTFDAKFSSRSPGDIYLVYARSVPELSGVGSDIVKLAAAGIGYGTWENAGGRDASVTNQMKAENLLRYPDIVIWLQTFNTNQKDYKFLHRRSVVAAMFKTKIKHPKLAEEFWRLVQTGGHSKPSDPTRVIQRYLMTTVIARKAGEGKQQASDHEMMSKCITAFNAWKKGENTALKYYAYKATPEVA